MSLVDHDSWDIEFEGCERLRHQLLVQLNQRRQVEIGSPEYVRLTGGLQSGVQQLRKDVAHLKVVLDNAITWETSPAEELQQRRIIYDKLNSQLREIQFKFTSSTRANQLAAATSSTSSSSVWQNSGTSSAAPRQPHDVESLKRIQGEILEDQNRGLEALSATISRQRQLAVTLGNEVEDQNTIIENLANTMDRVDDGVQRETRGLGQINRTDSTWGYWLVIVGLFVAILVVILL